ncbi:hypothetical protein MSG28_007383 [Choristoneura fumiferana]|uniref:Uncharacterized protein n=1 Tax=Choristoneura fumiferana TaxID=7141 RepID=A0ACC0JX51_CHOFU|nr:hypothetical protein MSG28_007383 [Choristoneura fumiferana]
MTKVNCKLNGVDSTVMVNLEVSYSPRGGGGGRGAGAWAAIERGGRSLRISGSGCEETLSSGSSSECEEPAAAPQDFPYVLNVTPDLPNAFEEAGGAISYLKIPIADHWSQNLALNI